MKFRTIFILFNLVIVLSFLFVFLLPLFLLGAEYSLGFWKSNWYLAAVFALVLGLLNAFFLYNWRTFILVESEDWKGLSSYLSERVFVRKRYGSREVSLYIVASILRGDVSGIEGLERELEARKPSLLARNAVLFGVTRLLRNRGDEAESFLGRYLDRKDVEFAEWLGFYHAFSQVLQKKAEPAQERLRAGLASKDAVLVLLSAYLLGSVCASALQGEARAALVAEAERARAGIAARFDARKWAREVERARNEAHIVVLSRLIEDCGRWLEEGRSAPTESMARAGGA